MFDSLPYERYVRSIPQLRPLLLTVALSNKQAAITNRAPILIIRPALIGYMDLRWFSFDWYATLGLPNEDTTTYVLKYRYGDWTHENYRKIRIKFDITGTVYTINHYSVLSGSGTLHDALRQSIHHQIPPDKGKSRREGTCVIKTLQAYSVRRGAV